MRTPLALICIIASVTTFAQSPTPTPPPFDAMGLSVPANTPKPAAPAATPTAEQVAKAQVQFHSQERIFLQQDVRQIRALYLQALQQFSDDPLTVAVPLTAQQKVSALSAGELTEIVTLAWQLYDVLEPLSPNLPPPAIGRPQR